MTKASELLAKLDLALAAKLLQPVCEPQYTSTTQQVSAPGAIIAQHKLARQFGVLDNFYTSGEVSGDGHVWSTAAITSDYTEKTWQIGYRSLDRKLWAR